MGWLRPQRDHATERLEAVRAQRLAQGHELTALQEGILTTIATSGPDQPDAKVELDSVRQAIAENGRWSETQEWRIGTWFDSEIAQTERDGRRVYKASVHCDGQTLSCEGPSLERVFTFLHLYQAIIWQGFYTVGPPWAD